jgi:hypothetical protein
VRRDLDQVVEHPSAAQHPARGEHDHRPALRRQPLRLVDAAHELDAVAQRSEIVGAEPMLGARCEEQLGGVDGHRAVHHRRSPLGRRGT